MPNFDKYEKGMQCLLQKLGQRHDFYTEALTLQARLAENIAAARQYGDDENRRASRSQILDGLNRLALQTVGVSFNELCEPEKAGLLTPYKPEKLAWPDLPPCPFVAGPKITDPRLFVGRKEELRRLVGAMQGAQPISANVVGERRIGKSSLLYHFYQTWEQRVPTPGRYVVTYLSLQDAAAQTEREFYRAVARALLSRPVTQRNGLLVETLNQPSLNCRDFAGAIRDFRAHHLLPVFCLDEFEALLRHPREFNDGFYDALRALMDDNALMLVVASLKPLDIYRHQHRLTSSFFNLGHVLRLGELTEAEAADLVRLPASTIPGAAAVLSLEEQRLAHQWGGRHPCLLQLAGGFLYQARQEGQDAGWARKQFEAEAQRLPPSGPRLRSLGQPLRWLVWEAPSRLGRLARLLGGATDELSNWIVGIVILAVIILGVLGVLSQTQVVNLVRAVLGR